MSKKILRITSLVVTCFMLLVMFAGCSGTDRTGDNSSSMASTTAAPAASAAEVKAEPVVLDWLAYNNYAQPDPESEIIKQQEEWYNVKFNFWFVDEKQWDQVLGVKLASGEMPDVMKIPNTAMVEKYVKQGVLAPITDDMLKKIPVIVKQIDDFGGMEQTIDAMYEGKLYAIKQGFIYNIYPSPIVWRTDWLKNVGISKIPETLQDWEDAMYKFRNNDPDKNGKKDTYGMSDRSIYAVFGAYGQIPLGNITGKGSQTLRWTQKDNKYVFAATQPEMKDALTLLQKWYKDGVIDPEFITGENTGGYWALSQAFSNGKVGVTGNNAIYHWDDPPTQGGQCYADFIEANPTAKFGETFDMGKPPVGPDGKAGTIQGNVFLGGVGFTTKCIKEPRKVDAVLNMWNTISTDFDKYVYALWGVKDKHYTVDAENGNYSRIQEYAAADATAKIGGNVTLSVALNFDFAKKTSPSMFEFMDKYKGPGYMDYLVPATDASGKYLEDLKKLATEAYIRIISGDKPIEYFDEFVKTFNEKGGAEVEKQVNDAVTKLIGK